MSLVVFLTNIISFIFFLIVLSYYILIFLPTKKTKLTNKNNTFNSLTIITPAHNEEKYIKECILSEINASFPGDKEIIIVDDGSTDSTYKIVNSLIEKNSLNIPIRLIHTKHRGKAASINLALKYAKNELIAIIDADSVIEKNALLELYKTLTNNDYSAVTGVIKVNNKQKFLLWWVHIEQLFNSLIRMLFSKIHANIVIPGPISLYKKEALIKVKGFSRKGFSEDVDIAIRLIRHNYKIGFNENAIAKTNMPYTLKGFIAQRKRFAKGWINIFKKHLKLTKSIIDIYSLPLMLFTYVQAIIMSLSIAYNVIQGYIIYFASKHIFFSIEVIKYFIEWFSLAGTIRWIINVFSGNINLNIIVIISLIATLLTYPLYVIAILKYDKRLTMKDGFALFFINLFWLAIMIIYLFNIFEYFKKNQLNKWEKQN